MISGGSPVPAGSCSVSWRSDIPSPPFLLEQGGHIGYSVRPTNRNRGVAGAALTLGLAEAQALGITPVLLTVREGNLASRRVIERADGSYEDTRNGFRRYWFPGPHRTP